MLPDRQDIPSTDLHLAGGAIIRCSGNGNVIGIAAGKSQLPHEFDDCADDLCRKFGKVLFLDGDLVAWRRDQVQAQISAERATKRGCPFEQPFELPR
jgi:hypothetical protein